MLTARAPDSGNAAVAVTGTASAALGPFCRLPNAVAADPRLSAVDLAVLAYRMTFIGRFRALAAAARQGLGIGKDAFYASIRRLRDLGYLEREQGHQDDGTFGKAVESVNLDAAPPGRPGYQKVLRTLFDGALHAKSIGLVLYVRAQAPTYNLSAARSASASAGATMPCGGSPSR